MLVLSLFPGIGLLDMAFEQEGMQIVRGPDVIWGGDIRRFTPPAGKFDGIIGGPPCQMFSSLARLVEANGHKTRFGNLIPEFERCVASAEPAWFVMENVPAAPDPVVAGYGVKSFMLDNSHLAGDDGFGQEQRRVRKFCFGMRGVPQEQVPNLMKFIDLAVFFLPDPARTLTQWPVDNSAEAKTRKVAVTSTDGGVRPSEKKCRRDPITAGHMNPTALTERKHRKKAVSSSNGGTGSGDDGRITHGAGNNGKGRYKLEDAIRLQGLPAGFLDDAPFTAEGKLKAVANGVPLPMGLAIARAVKQAIGFCA